VTKIFLIIAAIADLALAALMISVSGFMFGGGPESMHAGSLAAVLYIAAVVACVALPIGGFILNRYGKAGLALALAWLPPGAGLIALALPAPY
jgi:hypothetical protein